MLRHGQLPLGSPPWIGTGASTTRRMQEDILAVEKEHADDLQIFLKVLEPSGWGPAPDPELGCRGPLGTERSSQAPPGRHRLVMRACQHEGCAPTTVPSTCPNEINRGKQMASITCSNCQTESAEGTAVCPGCGSALAPAAAAPMGAPAPAPAAASPGSQVKFDATKLSQTDRIVGIASFVLLISLFLSWFSVSFGSVSVSASGLSAHGYLYIDLILAIAIIGLLAVRALGVWTYPASAPVTEEQALLIATGINFVLVLIAFLLKPGGVGGGVGWSFGAFIGLAASIVALVPLARPALAARKAK
jgi:hypothetical protein